MLRYAVLSMGEASGTSPEIILRSVIALSATPGAGLIITGDRGVFERVASDLSLVLPFTAYAEDLDSLRAAEDAGERLIFLSSSSMDMEAFSYGCPTAETGHASYKALEAAVDAIQNGLVDFAQVSPAAMVHHDAMELGLLITSELMAVGIPAASLSPGSCFVMDEGRLVVNDEEVIRRMSHVGIMPVTHGDVVMDRQKGFAIVSGDELMEVMARIFKPERIVFVSDIDGLYDSNPKENPEARMIPEVTQEILDGVSSDEDVDDVTGGVRNKMEAMLRMCSPDRDCVLVNGTVPGRLLSLLRGEEVTCTVARM